MAHPIEVAGVEQIDAGIEGRMDRGDAFAAFRRAIHARHAHAAEAKGGDIQWAEGAVVHEDMSYGLWGMKEGISKAVSARRLAHYS